MMCCNKALVSAVIVLVGLCACAAGPPRTKAERARDEQVSAAVQLALEADPRIYARHIDVSVEDGVAHLTGFVWLPEELYYAKSDAAGVPGVYQVSNELELKSGGIGGSPR
jgi:osmotically-inducible protein OsmY